MFKVKRNSKGFTLIELLIVIAIIGILAAIAIPAYTGYTKKSKMSGVTSALGAVKNALVAYYTEKGSISSMTGISNIEQDLAIKIPQQYINNLAITVSGNEVNITATINGIASDVNGGTVTLSTNNITTGATWTYIGSNNAINSILPKQ